MKTLRDGERKSNDDTLLDTAIPALRRFLLIVILFTATGGAIGLAVVLKATVYSASAYVGINRATNNTLEAVTNRFGVNGMSSNRFSQEDPYVDKLIAYFTSRDFFEEVAGEVMVLPAFPNLRRSLELSVSPRLQSVLEMIGLVSPIDLEVRWSASQVAEALSTAVTAGRDQGGRVVLGATLRDKHAAVLLANILVDKAVKYASSRDLLEFDEARTYIDSRIDSIKKTLDDLHGQMRDTGGIPLASIAAAQRAVPRSAELANEIEFAKARLKQNEEILRDLRSRRERVRDGVVSRAQTGSPRETYRRLDAQLRSLDFRRSQLLLQGVPASAKAVAGLDAEIAVTSQELARARASLGIVVQEDELSVPLIEGHIERIMQENIAHVTQIQVAEGNLKRAQKTEEPIPALRSRQAEIQRQINVQYDLMTELYRNSLQFDFQRISVANKVRVVGKAHLATAVSRPRAGTTIAFGGLVGLMLGGALATYLDRRRPTVNSRADLATFGVPVIASVPIVRSQGKTRVRANRRTMDRAAADHFFASNVIAFKFLRTRLMSSLQGTGDGSTRGKTIAVLSASPSEGKTFIASNTAAALAMVGKKTLLLDADIAGSRLAQSLCRVGTAGLTEVLRGTVSLDDVIVRDIRHNLDLLVAGSPAADSSEMLTRPIWHQILADVRSRYDFVVIDTPPALVLPDALLLASQMDGIVFSVMQRRTLLSSFAEALASLTAERQDGVYLVLNRSEATRIDGAYRYLLATDRRPSSQGDGLHDRAG